MLTSGKPASYLGKNSQMRVFVAALAGLFAAACLSPPGPTKASSVQTVSGEQLLRKYCSSCHAIGRNDESRHHDAPAFRTLSRSYPVSDLQESLAEGIVVGHPDMPEFKFPAEDVAAIISYLESIQQR
jgi:mono/diheme cytochrome c family protein